MNKFENGFMLGASTAAHQVEGNNTNSDYWVMENMEYSQFVEPSLDAVDHYNRYEEDIKMLADAGLNTYRFSVEWARIEPEQGKFDEKEIEHYRKMIKCCRDNGVEPVITLMHFTSPVWLIKLGGWDNEQVVELFANYARFVTEQLGSEIKYICTINEANMRLQHTFVSATDANGDMIVIKAHQAAKEAIKAVNPDIQVGITLSLHDCQYIEGGKERADSDWNEEFSHYIPYIKDDDFFGLQNYTRTTYGPDGIVPVPERTPMTQMDYEVYPEALEHVIRRVHEEMPNVPIMVTENGIATADDKQRVEFIDKAIEGVQSCINDGIPVIGYCHWSLIDNFEWQKGYALTFGLCAVDRKTQIRAPKPSLKHLGGYLK